jgi:hypothetical protein
MAGIQERRYVWVVLTREFMTSETQFSGEWEVEYVCEDEERANKLVWELHHSERNPEVIRRKVELI